MNDIAILEELRKQTLFLEGIYTLLSEEIEEETEEETTKNNEKEDTTKIEI